MYRHAILLLGLIMPLFRSAQICGLSPAEDYLITCFVQAVSEVHRGPPWPRQRSGGSGDLVLLASPVCLSATVSAAGFRVCRQQRSRREDRWRGWRNGFGMAFCSQQNTWQWRAEIARLLHILQTWPAWLWTLPRWFFPTMNAMIADPHLNRIQHACSWGKKL